MRAGRKTKRVDFGRDVGIAKYAGLYFDTAYTGHSVRYTLCVPGRHWEFTNIFLWQRKQNEEIILDVICHNLYSWPS